LPSPPNRAFELLHRLGDKQLPAEGMHETVDSWAVWRGADVTIVLTNHALPRQPIGLERVSLELEDAPPARSVILERIDEEHANAKAEWVALGCPEYPSAAEIRQMEEASRTVGEAHGWVYEGRTVRVEVDVPAHAVAAVTVKFAAAAR
jgi:xylan 1,4-beta-xylosidase